MVEFANGSIQESTIRTSSTAVLNATEEDPVVECLVKRLAEFQGFIPLQAVERLQVTVYAPGQYYGQHLDTLGNYSQYGPYPWSRTTTAFGILDVACEKCGTQFPNIKVNWDNGNKQDWCGILDCKENTLTVNPVPGSVLMWRNLHSNGSVDWRTLHAGMPVMNGSKAGVNIWTNLDPAKHLVV